MKPGLLKTAMLFFFLTAITGTCDTLWLALSKGGVRGRTVQQAFIFPRTTNFPAAATIVFVPLRAEIAVHAARNGQLITTVLSDEKGNFKVFLAPGIYELRPKRIPPGSGDLAPIHPRLEAERRTIRVRRGQFTPVEIRYSVNSAV